MYSWLTRSERVLCAILFGALSLFSIAIISLALQTGKYSLLWVVPGIFLLPIAIFIFAQLIPIALHEFGHYLAGRLTGHRFKGIIIGPLCWKYDGKRLIFSFDRNRQHGLMLMEPAPGVQPTRAQRVIYIAGGPFLSFISAIVFLLLGLKFLSHRLLGSVFLMQSFLNGSAFLMFFSKRKVDAFEPDRILLKKALQMSPQEAVQIIRESSTERPREWNKKAIRALSDPPGPPLFNAWAHWIVFHYYLDSDNFDAAKEHLDSGMESIEDQSVVKEEYVIDLFLEGAAIYAAKYRDIEKARLILNRVRKGPLHSIATARRAILALDYAIGDVERARLRLNRALRLADSSAESYAEVERSYLQRLERWSIEQTPAV